MLSGGLPARLAVDYNSALPSHPEISPCVPLSSGGLRASESVLNLVIHCSSLNEPIIELQFIIEQESKSVPETMH